MESAKSSTYLNCPSPDPLVPMLMTYSKLIFDMAETWVCYAKPGLASDAIRAAPKEAANANFTLLFIDVVLYL